LLVLSDVHLGSDLNDIGEGARRSQSVDEDLIKLLEHYRARRPREGRWRLVIAGDFIDFIGMAITPRDGEELQPPASVEELQHGVGNAADHSRLKLRRVADRHSAVFEALARFLADGNVLTIVHGNHDLEFHWEAVQKEFRAILGRLAHGREDAFAKAIDFNPWFFYLGGVAYIEHGHQYDPLCATEHVMAPLSPLNPRQIARGFCDVMLRFVVRPTRGLKEHGHDQMGVVDYLAFAGRLGLRGMLRLGSRFARGVVELFRVRRAHLSEAARALREEQERRMKLLAEATRIGIDRLKALRALQVAPVTRSIRGILASVLLDRLAVGVLAFLTLVVCAIGFGLRGSHQHLGVSAAAVLGAWFLAHLGLTRLRPTIEPNDELKERAAHLARLFPAAFVVMGHTHVPVKMPVNDGAATYVNLGSWAEEEEDHGGRPSTPGAAYGSRAARTHLVIHRGDAGPIAEFLAWSEDGPRQFTT
jgi:UDP-2,3-diacylglucosamine pyrophosphatase LpxH